VVLEVSRLIGRLDLGTRVLIFTMHDSSRIAVDVRDAGAHGYVSKSQANRDLVLTIQTLLSGGTFFGVPSEPSPGARENPDRGVTFRVALHWPNRLRPCSV
jgi:DNA-binding NarL/FixJ family response regulator